MYCPDESAEESHREIFEKEGKDRAENYGQSDADNGKTYGVE